MLNEAPNPSKLNFTMFLTLFGDKMTGYDPEDVIKNAFACFDPDGTGKIDEEKYVNFIIVWWAFTLWKSKRQIVTSSHNLTRLSLERFFEK